MLVSGSKTSMVKGIGFFPNRPNRGPMDEPLIQGYDRGMEPIFPGMDPYLEAPGVWPDFHDAYLAYAREALQPLLPRGYYALLRDREELGIAGYAPEVVMFPAVAVKRSERKSLAEAPTKETAASGTATLPERLIIAAREKPKVNFLEIRDASRGDRLVTLIELLSPSNKVAGPDREAFERKQNEVLASEANWVEVDLLRGGKRIGCHGSVDVHCRKNSKTLAPSTRGSAISAKHSSVAGIRISASCD